MSDEIRRWLDDLEFGEYADAFAENRVDIEVLPTLTGEDLKDIGVLAVGDRRKLLNAIALLREGDNETSTDTAETAEPEQTEALRRQVTVLFADISGFTTLSNQLDAEEIHALLNRFFAIVDEIVSRFGGAIDKHIGDAVMAVFGAPIAHTDDPERALRAALDIHEAVAGLEPAIKVHIGVASGQVVASSTGSAAHTEYTVTGDSVNLAARLTDMAAAGQTFTSSSVRLAIGDRFEGLDKGQQLIPGMPEPIAVHELTGLVQRQPHIATFVGRKQELEAFETAVARCLASDRGETIIVRGEAGIGKTSLLEEFRKTAKNSGFAAHTGLVLDFGAERGEDAVGALVRGLLNIAPHSEASVRAEAAESVLGQGWIGDERRAFLYDLLHLELPADIRGLYDAMDNTNRMRGRTETLTALVAAAARSAPLLVMIEDLHWADGRLLDDVAALARTTAVNPILLLLTTRLSSDPLDGTWRTKCSDAHVEWLDIGPMAAAEATDLAHSFGDLDEDVIRGFIEKSGGNPLFLEQLLRNVDHAGEGELPGTVQGIVQARMDALASKDRRALQAASILGQRFTLAALGAVMDDVQYRPDELLRQSLVRPAGEDFHFSHALIRDGVYASLLKPQRITLHGRAASFYEGADLTLWAQHLDQAEDDATAAAYLAAARQRFGRFHYDGALELVDRALELDVPKEVRFDLTCFQGDLRRALAQTALSIDSFERALQEAGNDEQFCLASLGLADGLRVEGRQDDSFAVLDGCQETAETNDFHDVLAELHYLRGSLFHRLGRLDEMEAEQEISLKHAQSSDSVEAEARALGGLADTNYSKGRMRTANGYFTRCVELSEKHGLMQLLSLYKPMLAWSEMFLLQLDKAIETATAACRIGAQTGEARGECVGHNVLSEMYFLRENYQDMREHGDISLQLARRIGARRYEQNGHRQRGLHQYFVDGDRESALATLREAYQVAMASTPSFMGPWSLGALALIADSPEERDWALTEGERLLGLGAYSHNHFGFHGFAMDVCLDTKDWDGVLAHAAALEEYCAPEPVPWSDFYIRRGRALAAVGKNQHGEDTIRELRDLKEFAETAGLKRALPAIRTALEQIGNCAPASPDSRYAGTS